MHVFWVKKSLLLGFRALFDGKTRPTFTLPFVFCFFYPPIDGAYVSNPGHFFSPVLTRPGALFPDSRYLVPRSFPFRANRPLLSSSRSVLWFQYPAISISALARPFRLNSIWLLVFSTAVTSLWRQSAFSIPLPVGLVILVPGYSYFRPSSAVSIEFHLTPGI